MASASASVVEVKMKNVNISKPPSQLSRSDPLEPQDAWLPITESRKGNALYAAFHTLSSGIGFQALLLPLAFSFLDYTQPRRHHHSDGPST
ncbi:hypothetical protein V2J09_018064 [Rumex salicifolius]